MSLTEPPDGASNSSLKKEINTLQLWSIAVGMVISGIYFGWNYGWAIAGTLSFLVATTIVTVLYITFIFSYTELTAAIPDAGGPFTYARRAFGEKIGFLAGFGTFVDFVLAPPAIAFALGSYSHFLNSDLPVLVVAVCTYVIFIIVNLLGIKESANFSTIITILSVAELLIFMVIVFPYYKTENFVSHSLPISAKGVFASLPYAVWFYIAIEGVAMVAEEVKTPNITIPKAYILSILTLVFLTFGIIILCGGATDWRLLSNIDYPLPETLSLTLGRNSFWSKAFASLGLFGLIASFHCNTIGYSRQIYALARDGFLPKILSKLHSEYRTPHYALFTGGIIGLIALFTGKTEEIIILSVLGALVMYITSMLSLLKLRKSEPNLNRPYKTPFYPYFPIITILLSTLCLLSIIQYNIGLSILFFSILTISFIFFLKVGIKFIKPQLK